MWIGVRQRFAKFGNNLRLTADQVSDGATKHQGVRRCLNRHYYDKSCDQSNSFLIGSWAKGTRVSPPRDIDLYFLPPIAVYNRFQDYVGNGQSALLQEVKNVLLKTYPATTMRGDGQVVLVGFGTISVEVVPAFEMTNGRYLICDTNNGGSYKETDPNAENEQIGLTHSLCNNNLKPIIKMLKTWQSHCHVPLKSFLIEILANDFLINSQWRDQGYFYYDWLMRDFFRYLLAKKNGYVFAPGTFEVLMLGNAWETKAASALNRALKACEYERDDYPILAGEEWQKIFGSKIPMYVT